VPLALWFRRELRGKAEEVLLEEESCGEQFFNGQFIKEIMQKHVTGEADYSRKIWALLVFKLWQRHTST